eukprot:10095896-Ditylum_brightwellii.AAC.1
MPKTDNSNNDKEEWKSFPLFANFSADTIKPTLPISYDTNLPHFDIPVGKKEDKIRISVAYDTCA